MTSVTTIDCEYLQPQFAAAYLIENQGYAAFVDNNTTHAVPKLMAALQRQGLRPEQVEYVIVTHVHLDHAGGSSALMRACPNAQLLAHPRAVRHLVDPSRLVASAQSVYGAEKFAALYGEIHAIDGARVRAVEDEEELDWRGRRFRFLHTPGHAKHHICIIDSQTEGVFTGDTFGLVYPALQKRGFLILPSTSPTDFEPALAKASVERILATGAKRAFLTHFGEISHLSEAASDLLRHLDFSEALLEEAVGRTETGDALEEYCHSRLQTYWDALLTLRFGADPEPRALLKLDLQLNAAGIAYAAAARR